MIPFPRKVHSLASSLSDFPIPTYIIGGFTTPEHSRVLPGYLVTHQDGLEEVLRGWQLYGKLFSPNTKIPALMVVSMAARQTRPVATHPKFLYWYYVHQEFGMYISFP